MKNRALNLSSYSFSTSEALLFDANIWLYLFPAPSKLPPKYAQQYSSALKRMLQAGSPLVLDALVLSEYLNSYCRIEWKALHLKAHPHFKSFRQSSAFCSVSQNAAVFARKILGLCSRHDHPFAGCNVVQVLNDFETGAQDLNDGLLVETCRHHGWKLVTNDGDFTNGGIEVLTTNPKLIAACP